MDEKRWAEKDENWRAKEARALRERAANQTALRDGNAAPFPNPFWFLDSTKAPAGASPEEITRSYQEFSKICRRPTRKRFTI
jgi:hypothetical protein